MDNYIFTLAKSEDVDTIISLIKCRIDWMNENNIHQWNDGDYFKSYPYEYFHQSVCNSQLFVLKNTSSQIVGAVTIKNADPVWDNKENCYYIHNLVTHTKVSGIGSLIMHFCENTIKSFGGASIRLDCQRDNIKLNKFYEKLGFSFHSFMEDGDYRGSKREKLV